VYGAFGLVGAALGWWFRAIWLCSSLCMLLASVVWHVRGLADFPGSRRSRQSNRRRAQRGVLGSAYFGGVLGVGLVTEMTTPLVLTGAMMAVANALPWAILYGVGFGVGRSVASWVGVLIGGSGLSAGVVVEKVLDIASLTRWVAVIAALIGFYIDLAALVH
jgi:hypothetical protein